MADAITIKALQDASLDAKSLEEVVNGNEVKQVTTRKGETYPSVKKAIKTLFENGGLPATPFKTKALMTASVLPDGKYAQVTDDSVATNNGLYVKTAGVWVKSDYDPFTDATTKANAAEANAIAHANSKLQEGPHVLSVADENGNLGFLVSDKEILLKELTIKDDPYIDDFLILDKNGKAAFSAKTTNQIVKTLLDKVNGLGPSPSSGQENSVVSEMDSEALAYAVNLNNTVALEVQKPVFDYNIVITYGQSLSTANEGYPALSKTPIEGDNVLMFGDSVRSLDRLVANWRPVGGAALKGLIATNQQRLVADSIIMTDEEVATLAAGSQHEGESFDVGAVNFWRKQQNDFRGVSANPSRKIVVLNCGVAGTSIEQLSKDATPNLFNRMVIAATQLKEHILGINPDATIGLVAILHAQGEYNYSGIGTKDKTTFLNLTKQLRTDILSDVAYGIFGQSKPPAFITYQTAGQWAVDSTNLSIANAQLEMTNTVEGCYLATPAYHITDKGGHLDSNGYRWMGMYFGKVLHKVMDRGIAWKPLQPINMRFEGRDIYINFHVPNPPLQFKEVYDVLVEKNYANKGFKVTDNGVNLAIENVEIVGACTVRIRLVNEARSGLQVWYGSKSVYNGGGNLCDSDKTVVPFNYEYLAGSGQYAEANIPALVNKPYPVNNYCVIFTKTLTY